MDDPSGEELPHVSIHAPAWGATVPCSPPQRRRMFQSTLPRGERRSIGEHVTGPALVSIHAPAWGATSGGNVSVVTVAVSIHAPAWGATDCGSVPPINFTVSIHAPAWGATQAKKHLVQLLKFQSTLPRGERR